VRDLEKEVTGWEAMATTMGELVIRAGEYGDAKADDLADEARALAAAHRAEREGGE
jgi:hypothetical protein